MQATSFLKTGYESAIKNHKDSAMFEQLREKKISKATTCNTLFCLEARCASATKKKPRIQQTQCASVAPKLITIVTPVTKPRCFRGPGRPEPTPDPMLCMIAFVKEMVCFYHVFESVEIQIAVQ